jgi:hypothetical protein
VIVGAPSSATLIEYLEAQTPIILGIGRHGNQVGHAVVITAAIFTGDRKGNPKLKKVILRDPSPEYRDTLGKRELLAADYESAVYHVVLDTIPTRD